MNRVVLRETLWKTSESAKNWQAQASVIERETHDHLASVERLRELRMAHLLAGVPNRQNKNYGQFQRESAMHDFLLVLAESRAEVLVKAQKGLLDEAERLKKAIPEAVLVAVKNVEELKS